MDLKNFIRMILGFKPGSVKDVSKILTVRRKKNKNNEASRHQISALLNWLVVSATWLLIISSLISLGGIIAMPLVNPVAKVPDILSHIITLTLGYFGGVVSAFIRLNTTIGDTSQN